MFSFILQIKEPPGPRRRNYDCPDAFAISPAQILARDSDRDLTCLCLIRRKKGKAVSMKIILRDYASE